MKIPAFCYAKIFDSTADCDKFRHSTYDTMTKNIASKGFWERRKK